MSANDVELACDVSLDGVVLRNHGGRNLDTSLPTMSVAKCQTGTEEAPYDIA